MVSLALFLITGAVFQNSISFSELDYQLYVAGNNPEEQNEFHSHSLSGYIDIALKDENMRSYWIGKFYPTEPIVLRNKLKAEIQNLMLYNRWPHWFEKIIPDDLKYQAKRSQLLTQYDLFIEKWPSSRRMPIALYYKALLNEYHPDIRYFEKTETLRFYSDYPYYENILIWNELRLRFPNSPESLEARWRIAQYEAGQKNFKKANEYCDVALVLLQDEMDKMKNQSAPTTGLLSVFQSPSGSAMTVFKLQEQQVKIRKLKQLISPINQGDSQQQKDRLGRFASLNPYSLNYVQQLDELLATTPEEDPLRDNILLARAQMIPDAQLRTRELLIISKQYTGTDGGIQALYELGLLKVQQWKEIQSPGQQKTDLLNEARDLLSQFIETYPDSIYISAARQMLGSLPQKEI